MSVLRLGSTGPDVARLQELLGTGAEFGPKTDEAVRRFQKGHGLVSDGKVTVGGGETWPALVAAQSPATVTPQSAPGDKRELAARIARSGIGGSDANAVWAAVNARRPYPAHWCWAYVLMCWRQAGIVDWDFSKGVFWLSSRLPTTLHPLVADCAYFDKHQHHAMVVGVDTSAKTVDLVNGNGEGGKVTLSERVPFSKVTVFYSIAREL